MSLINEALKKAQQDVNGGDSPAARRPGLPVGADSTRAGRRRAIGLAALVTVVVVAVAYLYFDGADAVEVPPPVVVAPPPPPVPVPTPAPVVATEAPIIITAPIVPKAAAPVAPPALVVAVVSPVVEVVAPVPAAPVKNARVEAMVDLMRVTLGVVRTGRCVVDGIVFKVGDTITTDPLITVKAVGDASVSFADANGIVYEKKYR